MKRLIGNRLIHLLAHLVRHVCVLVPPYVDIFTHACPSTDVTITICRHNELRINPHHFLVTLPTVMLAFFVVYYHTTTSRGNDQPRIPSHSGTEAEEDLYNSNTEYHVGILHGF